MHAERLSHYDQVRTSATGEADAPDLYALAVLDFGRHYERAVLDWFAQLPPELTTAP